jgi:hypothetical protein
MECFSHPGANAVAVCKSCGKAVCRTCARDTGVGVVCSDACAKEAAQANDLTESAKRAYGLGERKPRLPLTATMHGLFGVFLIAFGGYETWRGGSAGWFLLGFGTLICVFAVLAYRRSKAMGLPW